MSRQMCGFWKTGRNCPRSVREARRETSRSHPCHGYIEVRKSRVKLTKHGNSLWPGDP